MSEPRRYKAVYANEWVQPVKENYGLACCDCGLVHKLDFRVKNGRIQFRARRDNRATSQLRRRSEYASRVASKPVQNAQD